MAEESAALDDTVEVTLGTVVSTEEDAPLYELSLYIVDAAALETGADVLVDEGNASVAVLGDGTTTTLVGMTEGIAEDKSELSRENVGKG